jgi:hypothetical protein
MDISITGIPTQEVERLRAGGLDANGQKPLINISEGGRNPCRHCLQPIEEGAEMLVLAYRPFEAPQPYAEIGPIFLHNRACTRYQQSAVPGWFPFLDPAIVRGYDANDWIRYETGEVIRGPEIEGTCRAILNNKAVAYVHVRSKFNCFQCRVDRAG